MISFGDLRRFVKVWLMVSSRAAQDQLLTSWSGLLFLLGKIVRFILFFIFLFSVLSAAGTLAGLSKEQVVLFFLVFNLIDISFQFLFRGVYHFRFRIVRGDFDLDLVKPLPSFFRPIFGWTDILDLVTLIPLGAYFIWHAFEHQLFLSFFHFISFLIFWLNSLVIGFSIHLLVVSVGILTMEIDHLVLVYRDIANMAQFPTDIYQRGVRYFLTFGVPVVVLVTVPAKAWLGLLSWPWVSFSLAIGVLFLWGSLRFWHFALRHYSSASS